MNDEGVTISLETTARRLVIESIETANFIHTQNWHKQTLSDIPMCGERKFYTRSELIGLGFSRTKVDMLPAFTVDSQTDTIAKHVDQQTAAAQRSIRANDLIEIYEIYINLPKGLVATSSESERWRVVLADRVVLDKEKTSLVPYASGTPWIVQNRWTGLSVYDKGKSIQDCKTAALRQYTDNLSHINNARFFVQGDVNRQELGTSAPGHHVTGGLNATLTPIPVADMGMSAIQYMDYMDRVRSQRMGAAVDMAQADSQLITKASNAGATGMAIAAGEQEMMTASITRTMSETLIRQLFLLVHRVAREQYRQPMSLRRADNFETVNPATWPVRKRVNVKTGLSTSERGRKVSALGQVMQLQQGLAQAIPGSVSQSNMYRSTMNWCKAAELDNPEQYFLHPEGQEAQQMSQQASQGQQQQQQMEVQLQTLSDQVKLKIAQMEDKTKRDIAVLQSEVEEMKVVGSATKELELERLRAGNEQDSQGGNGSSGGDKPAGRAGSRAI